MKQIDIDKVPTPWWATTPAGVIGAAVLGLGFYIVIRLLGIPLGGG